MFPLLKYSDADVETCIANATAGAVRTSLGKARHDWFDLLNLISGAAGPKADYDWRLGTQLRAERAGFCVLGCAFLLGLGPWRREAASRSLTASREASAQN